MIDEQKLISVIIPVYNVEKYLEKCLNSVINQTYKNLEIIVIDDGSTDNSGKICDEYAKKDSRIIVIHTENGGVSSARNKGLEVAKGEYIGFVDSDDYIEDNMYEILYRNLVKFDVDISMCNYYIVRNNKKTYHKHNIDDILLIDNKEKFFELLNSNYYKGFLCNKLFKSDIMQKKKLEEDIYVCEDLLFISQIADISERFCFDNRCFYNYVMRENSAISGKITEKNFSVLNAYKKVIDIVKKYNEKIARGYEIDYFKWENDLIRKYKFKNKIEKKNLESEVQKLYKEIIKSKNIKISQKIECFFRYRMYGIYNVIRKTYHMVKSKKKGLTNEKHKNK